jgi:two-component system response regulator YesN
MTDGDIIFIPPNADRIRLSSDEVCKYFSINFRAQGIKPLPVLMRGSFKSEVFAFWNLLYEILRGESNFKDELTVNLTDGLLTSLYESDQKESENPHITKIKKYISDNYRKKITLRDVADCVYLNPSYCSYLVKKELGVSVFELINRERISYAKSLILEGGRSLNEISNLVGFDNYGYFSRQFKQLVGASPSIYKSKKLMNI